MKVKIISDEKIYRMMDKLEEELGNINDEDIFDIQFCLSTSHSAYSTERNSVIIMYRG